MAEPRVFPSVAADDDLFARLDRRRVGRVVAQRSATEELAQAVSALRDAYPHLDATVIVRLAQAGVSPDDPRMAEIANAGAKKKSKSGLGWHSIGDAVSSVGRLGDTVLGGLDELVADITKPVIRGAALGAQSLYEEAQGVVRNVAAVSPEAAGAGVGAALGSIVPGVGTAIGAGVGAGIGGALGFLARDEVKGEARWEPQSSGVIALGRLLHGEKVDIGSGFLPNVDANDTAESTSIGETQRARARRVTVDGRSLTPGRLVTAGVVEPGSKPFNVLSGLVDASLALSRFDPSSAGLKVAGNVNRNRKLFVDAGGVFSHRPTTLPEVASAWISGEKQRRLVAAIAEEPSAYRVWDATRGQLGARLTQQLSEAMTERQVLDLLDPHLGTTIRGKFDYTTRRPLANVRLAQTMPGTHLDPDDADEAVTTVIRWLRNAKASPELVERGTNLMLAPETAIGRNKALKDVMKITEDLLVERGVDPLRARAMTRLEEAQGDDLKAFFVRSVTEPDVQVPGMYLDGETHGIVAPHMPTEMLNRTLTLPDARDVRRAASGFSAITDRELYKGAVAAVDFAQGQVWKKTALMRGAYTVRVIAEEQFRMAASGLDSLVNHPLSLISMRLGRKASEDTHGGEFKYQDADAFLAGMDEHNRALNRGFAGWAEGVKTMPVWRRFRKGDAGFEKAWASEIVEYAADPVMREIASRADDLDTLKADWWGNGATTLADASTGLQRIRLRMAEGAGGLLDRTVSDRYIDSMLDRLTYKTGGNSELMGYVASGKFGSGAGAQAGKATGDVRVGALVRASDRGNIGTVVNIDADSATVHFVSPDGTEATKTFTTDSLSPLPKGSKRGAGRAGPPKELQDFLNANLDIVPDDVLMKAQMTVAERGAGKMLDQATQWIFSNLMSERTNNLSRSPTFKQFYWQRQEELIPFMDADAQARVIARAREVGLGDAATRMQDTAGKHGAAAKVDFDQADHIAKGFGLDETRKLLYDMTEKSQFFDAYRLIFPFGEAWKEMATRWAKIGVEHPQALRRGQQVITGARGAGFFYTNENGEEVFAYPGSEWVSEKLIGVPVPLTGRVAGLSLMTEVLPGVGPVVQFSAGAFIQDKPEFDWMRNIIFPFGEPDTGHGVVESLLPAWVQKWRQAGVTPFGQDTRQFNGAVMDVARYLTSTGDYDTSTVDGINDLLDDASQKARYVYALRGAAQFFAPTAPTPEWVVADKTGGVHVAQHLVEEYHDLLEKDPEGATLTMLDRYGTDLFLLLQGKTAEVVPNAPISKAGADWERTHGAVVKAHPDVFGFFAPDDGDLDSAAFDRQMSKGRRVALTPDQAVRLGNNRIANALYQTAKRKVGDRPNSAQQAWLRTIREGLRTRFPGYGEHVGVPEKASVQTLVAGLEAAVADDRLADNPATQPIALYLQARERARQSAEAAGLAPDSFATARSMVGVRAWLRQIGGALIERQPAFNAVWERVFDRELADDAEAAPEGGVAA